MTSSPAEPTGLRERKKAKTRAAIQRHALRLFREQGYTATTVDQIAAAAEISPSTFFRYFPTKEATVLYDALDPMMVEAALAQPPELSLIGALRATLRDVYEALPEDAWQDERERQLLVFNEPELRAPMLEQYGARHRPARRPRGPPRSAGPRPTSRCATGRAPWSASCSRRSTPLGGDPDLLLNSLDEAFAHLEAGLPL